jgi:voltage-gated sodium channel
MRHNVKENKQAWRYDHYLPPQRKEAPGFDLGFAIVVVAVRECRLLFLYQLGGIRQNQAMKVRQRIGIFVESDKVQWAIITLIVLNAASLGLETVPEIGARFGPALQVFDKLVIAIFVLEISGKILYRGKYFFHSGWNVFDFVIVAISLIALIPMSGEISILRSLRLLRPLRLFSMVPAMRTVVRALFVAIPGLLAIVPILLLLFYMGAVLTTSWYGATFPDRFGSIGSSMYTLFQIMTLDDWSEGIVRPLMEQHPFSWVFFVGFILVISFSVLNLFVGIIVDAVLTQRTSEVRGIDHLDDMVEEFRGSTEQILNEIKRLEAVTVTLQRDLLEVRRILQPATLDDHRGDSSS